MSYGAEYLSDYAYEIDKSQRECVCGMCKWNRYDGDFYCGNKNSERYGEYTMYSDDCEEWEEK